MGGAMRSRIMWPSCYRRFCVRFPQYACMSPQHVGSRRLCRSTGQTMLAGVGGDLAKYLGWDVTIERVSWIVLPLAGGSGISLYLILWRVVPQGTS